MPRPAKRYALRLFCHLLFPLADLADGGTEDIPTETPPPPTEPTAEPAPVEATEQPTEAVEEAPIVEATAEPTEAVAEETPTVEATVEPTETAEEAPVEATAEPTETVEEAPGGEATDEPTVTPAEVTLAVEVTVCHRETTEEPAEPEEEATVAEIGGAAEPTRPGVVGDEGEIIPLVSQEAADALAGGSDPWFDAGGGVIVGYSPTATCAATVTECHAGVANAIQSAINDARLLAGGTLYIEAGTHTENVVVNKSITIAGAGQGTTIIQPGTSNPNCGGAGGSSLCAGSANVFLVQGDNVTIHDLTVDGNNPGISSGTTVGGVDIDARNGIITNHAAGVYNNLTVYNTTIQNVFLRGIYASSYGTFNIHDNTVTNVQGVTGNRSPS
jgi:hypothetical protein